MNKEIPNLVIIPENHFTDKKDFPVLYLLHGAYGDYTNWPTNATRIKELADAYDMIIVCPDGGSTSWYYDSPVDETMKYETYISEELINVIDATYKTGKNKAARAITGLSMGGHGAFYLALKHQDVYGACGSMSGGVDIRPFPYSWDLSKRLGSYGDHKKNWEENTVINMLHMIKKGSLKMLFDCGTEDFFHDGNQRLHKKMLERNIPHDYIARPGSHDWDYWTSAIEYQMLFFDKYFKSIKK